MKIAVVANEFYPIIGGGQNHLLNIYKRLVRRGHEVVIYTMYDREIKDAPRVEYYDGIRVERFRAFRMHRPFFYPFSLGLLLKLLKDDYDVIQFNCFDIVGFYGVLLKRIKKVPYFVHTHGFMWSGTTLLSSVLKPFFDLTIVRTTIKNADGIFCVSMFDKKEIARLREKGAYYVSTCVDTKLFRKRKNKGNRKIIIGEIARINEVKNQLTFVKAAAEVLKNHKNVEFVIAGSKEDSEYFNKVVGLIKDLGIEKYFRIYTNVEKRRIYDLYSELDIYVMPSVLEPGEPVSIIEAWASGAAVITSSVGGPKYLVEEGITGYHVSPLDHNGLARKISFLIENPKNRNLVARNGMKKAAEHNWDKLAGFIEKKFEEAIASR